MCTSRQRLLLADHAARSCGKQPCSSPSCLHGSQRAHRPPCTWPLTLPAAPPRPATPSPRSTPASRGRRGPTPKRSPPPPRARQNASAVRGSGQWEGAVSRREGRPAGRATSGRVRRRAAAVGGPACISAGPRQQPAAGGAGAARSGAAMATRLLGDGEVHGDPALRPATQARLLEAAHTGWPAQQPRPRRHSRYCRLQRRSLHRGSCLGREGV